MSKETFAIQFGDNIVHFARDRGVDIQRQLDLVLEGRQDVIKVPCQDVSIECEIADGSVVAGPNEWHPVTCDMNIGDWAFSRHVASGLVAVFTSDSPPPQNIDADDIVWLDRKVSISVDSVAAGVWSLPVFLNNRGKFDVSCNPKMGLFASIEFGIPLSVFRNGELCKYDVSDHDAQETPG